MRNARTRRSTVTRPLLGAVAATALLAAVATTPVLAAQSQPGPSRLQVARAGADSEDLRITWSPVTGVHHYSVTVFDGSTDHVFAVPAGTTHLTHDGSGICNRYRVTVAAVYPGGGVGRSGTFRVVPLAPGAVSDLEWTGGSVINWGEVSLPGYRPVIDYRVTLKQVSNGAVISTRETTDMTMNLPTLDAGRLYTATVVARSEFGSCGSARTQVRAIANTQTAPSKLTVARSAADPEIVTLDWRRPGWSNPSSLTGYEIGHRLVGSSTWSWDRLIGARTTSAELRLPDRDADWEFTVRALAGNRPGDRSPAIRLKGSAATGRDPEVTLRSTGANVIVAIDGPVGSSTKYSKLDIAIGASRDPDGFSDHHLISNGANQVVFGGVPCGLFTVVVTGQGTEAAREFSRSVVNRCAVPTAPTLSITVGPATGGAYVAADSAGASTDMSGTVTKLFPEPSGAEWTGSDEVDHVKYLRTQLADAAIKTLGDDDKVYFAEHARGTTSTGTGADIVYANQQLIGTVDLGDGADSFYAFEHVPGTLSGGDGNDHLQTRQSFQGQVRAGSGNDTLISGEAFSGTIEMGSGNDYAQTGQNITGTIDGGDGYDVIRFGDQNMQANWSTVHTRIRDFEHVIFANGTSRDIDASGNLVATGTNDALKVGGGPLLYPVTVTATAPDTTTTPGQLLEDVEIDAASLPSGTTLRAGGMALSVTAGKYRIDASHGPVSLQLRATSKVSQSALADITGSVSMSGPWGTFTTTTTAVVQP